MKNKMMSTKQNVHTTNAGRRHVVMLAAHAGGRHLHGAGSMVRRIKCQNKWWEGTVGCVGSRGTYKKAQAVATQ